MQAWQEPRPTIYVSPGRAIGQASLRDAHILKHDRAVPWTEVHVYHQQLANASTRLPVLPLQSGFLTGF
jgi:hypothetical protein